MINHIEYAGIRANDVFELRSRIIAVEDFVFIELYASVCRIWGGYATRQRQNGELNSSLHDNLPRCIPSFVVAFALKLASARHKVRASFGCYPRHSCFGGSYGFVRNDAYGRFRMNAQANKLSAVADNIANASTNGYKRGSTEFSSLVLPSTSGNYNSGSVLTQVRHNIGAQGGLTSTSSTTDLALDGNGFFVVQDASGMPYLTRAGSFVPDKNGDLVNVAGFTLMGYPYPFTGAGNGFDGMVPITLGQSSFPAEPTRNGTFTVNLPANGPDVDRQLSMFRHRRIARIAPGTAS